MKSVTSRKVYLYLFWVILFIIQNRLQQWFDPFQYLDEIFALLIVPGVLFWIIKKKEKIIWTKEKILFLVLLLVFVLSGWAGYFVYHYQPFANAVKDAYVNLKFFMAVGASFLMFANEKLDFEQLKKKIWPVMNAIVIFLFVLFYLL